MIILLPSPPKGIKFISKLVNNDLEFLNVRTGFEM